MIDNERVGVGALSMQELKVVDRLTQHRHRHENKTRDIYKIRNHAKLTANQVIFSLAIVKQFEAPCNKGHSANPQL